MVPSTTGVLMEFLLHQAPLKQRVCVGGVCVCLCTHTHTSASTSGHPGAGLFLVRNQDYAPGQTSLPVPSRLSLHNLSEKTSPKFDCLCRGKLLLVSNPDLFLFSFVSVIFIFPSLQSASFLFNGSWLFWCTSMIMYVCQQCQKRCSVSFTVTRRINWISLPIILYNILTEASNMAWYQQILSDHTVFPVWNCHTAER